MKSNHSTYDCLTSVARIDEILDSSDQQYEEVNGIPSRDRLTLNNGFYVDCSALFIDIRGSSGLPDIYKRRTLAKIYRSYISEAVAIINGNRDCSEIMIVGDAVSAVFDTTVRPQIDGVFDTAAQLNSLIRIINCRLKSKGMEAIRAGIGIAYGGALMIKAGYKETTISDVVWMGHVVNRAAKLCSLGSKGVSSPPIVVDGVFASNLKEEYQNFLSDTHQGYYTGSVVNVTMEKWLKENCK